MDNVTDPYLGQMVRGYRLEESSGHGKLMTLYRGRTQELWLLPEIAISLIHMPESLSLHAQEKFLTRFSDEAGKLIRLRHSSLFPLFGYGRQENYCYLLMPTASGLTLTDRLKQQPRWRPTDTLKILTPVAQALDYIHNQGLVHQFLHPGTILFQKRMPPQITGFRHAQMLMADNSLLPSAKSNVSTPLSHLKSLDGSYSGMAEYLAPEVIRDSEPDPRSDIYSLGVIMFEMLSGRTPFTGENYLDVALKHIREPLPSLRAISPDLPTVLELVVDRALHHNPQNRFQTAGEFIAMYSQAISKHSHTIYPARLQREGQTQPLSPAPVTASLPRATPLTPDKASFHEHSAPMHQIAVATATPDQADNLYPKNKEIIAMIDDFRKKMKQFQTRNTAGTGDGLESSTPSTHPHQ
jgi:serine/threonine-protein kinase